ncbi:MAG: ShlB/FhaC/HecB family hemolysin secretion/activation protein [Candidatus Omnitrophota bacterium]
MKNKAIIQTLAAIILCLYFCRSAYCQNYERAVREVDRPVREEAEKKLEAAPQKKPVIQEEKKPEKETGQRYFIKKVILSGCESFPPEEFSSITRQYENRDLSFDDLDELTQIIEREYLNKGVIAACFVPPQDLKDGVVTLYVVEAKMGNLEITPHKYFDNKKLTQYWEIKSGKPLLYYKISRSLQQINRNPDREVKATLHSGKKKGTTDIMLDAETHFPIHPIFSFNREGAAVTGRKMLAFGARHNNFLFLDDTLLTGYSYTKQSSNIYAYHMLPLSYTGTTLLYGFSKAKAFPKKDFEQYDLRSYAESASFFLHQDIYQKDNYLGDLYFGLDGKNKELYTNTGLLNKDRLRILRFGAKVVLRTPSTIINVRPEISQGINLFGALGKNRYSSRGAGNVFTKFNLGLQCKHNITSYIQLNLRGDAQFASEKLTPQEEFSLGGINSVRGYAYGDYYGDSAVQANAEVLVKPAFLPGAFKLPFSDTPLRENITGVFFFDYGYGWKRGKVEGEKYQDKLASVGAGIRMNLYDQLLVRLEGGFPIGMGDKGITEGAVPRLHIVIEFEDKMLDKLANIARFK